jgi:hypothetical protein
VAERVERHAWCAAYPWLVGFVVRWSAGSERDVWMRSNCGREEIGRRLARLKMFAVWRGRIGCIEDAIPPPNVAILLQYLDIVQTTVRRWPCFGVRSATLESRSASDRLSHGRPLVRVV